MQNWPQIEGSIQKTHAGQPSGISVAACRLRHPLHCLIAFAGMKASRGIGISVTDQNQTLARVFSEDE